MRGVPEQDIHSSEFMWEGDNGDVLLTVYLPHGYSNAMFMPDNYTRFKLRIAAAHCSSLKNGRQAGIIF